MYKQKRLECNTVYYKEDLLEELQVCYKVHFRRCFCNSRKIVYYQFRRLTTGLYRRCFGVVAVIDVLLEQEIWLPDVAVFPEVFTFSYRIVFE